MSFHFVNLSSQLVPESVPLSSPLHHSLMTAQAIADSPNPEQPRLQVNLFMVGILLVHEQRGKELNCIRQDPVFIRSGGLGIFVPFGREVEEYAGVHLYGDQNVANVDQVVNTVRAISEERSKDYLPTTVEFHSFDTELVTGSNFDLVRNMALQSESSECTYCIFNAGSFLCLTFSYFLEDQSTEPSHLFISNLYLPHLASLRDHFVGYIELEGRQWPVSVHNGYLTLKVSTFDSLLRDFPFWIDSQYRIRLGAFSADYKSRPVLTLTTMSLALPMSFEYSVKCTVKSSTSGRTTTSSSGGGESNDSSGQTTRDQQSSNDAAGVPMAENERNTLRNTGQIPRNFPVLDKSPNITVDSWLPRFIHEIISQAKKKHVELARLLHRESETVSLASVHSAKSKSSSKRSSDSSKSSCNKPTSSKPAANTTNNSK